jgi:hypothetical protein
MKHSFTFVALLLFFAFVDAQQTKEKELSRKEEFSAKLDLLSKKF